MPEEIIRVREHFYILASSPRIDDRTRVLKHGDTFAAFNRFGDIDRFGGTELGLYHQDTRFLSRLAVRLGGTRPLLLSSTVRDDNGVMVVDATNPDLWRDGDVIVPRGTVHLFRSKLVWGETCHERLRLHNYGRTPVDLVLEAEFDADFADIFEVRGMARERRGRRVPVEPVPGQLTFAYEGLDGRLRRTRIVLQPVPSEAGEGSVAYRLHLPPRGEATLSWAIRCEVAPASAATGVTAAAPVPAYEEAARQASAALAAARAGEPRLFTSNEQFNDWLHRSLADLHMMRTETPHGPYPYAGVPWFSTAFGRDGLVTALECLWFDPAVACGVLRYLAATQALDEDAERDAQPGKILHETRAGEMAALGEVPFARYYGSVDATPLFVMLAGAYYERTGDAALVREIWPSVDRALAWIESCGDADGDGFVEYARRSSHGLVQQGWKDSQDSVSHADGTLAEPPIALCEVQGYAYAARRAGAALARRLGLGARAAALDRDADRLRERFEAAFWCEEIATYALALDGSKRPCRVVSSNAGHCLFAGIAGADRARRVAATLLQEDSFSGWGVRTLAAGHPRYNPMSYHNGSVWPHDNALIAAGLARYGLKDEALAVLTGLFDASLFFDLHRLPELFCGFPRRPGESPTLYPVSCSPQAWASGAVLLLLQACLGLDVRAADRRVVFANPRLPEFLDEVRIDGLRVGDASLDLALVRYGRDVGINVLRRTGDVTVVAVK